MRATPLLRRTSLPHTFESWPLSAPIEVFAATILAKARGRDASRPRARTGKVDDLEVSQHADLSFECVEHARVAGESSRAR
jgi:hypothetical protein